MLERILGMQFTRSQQRGLLVMLSIMVVAVLAPIVHEHFYEPPPIDTTEFQQQISDYQRAISPSTLPKQPPMWMADTTGLSITIDRSTAIHQLDLNTITQERLMVFKGIGKAYAERIIKFRGLLGGYYSPQQLYEVYGLGDKPNTIEAMLPQLSADTSKLRRMDIRLVNEETLTKHPYIGEEVAKKLITHREAGNTLSLVIVKSFYSDAKQFEKAAHYLKFAKEE